MLTRRSLLHGLSATTMLVGCGVSWRSVAEASLTRGLAALWAMQGPDGAFRSTVYGLLGQGWSLTPFALLSALRTGRVLDLDGAGRALGWMAHGTRDGALGLADGVPDYPCYATAMALECHVRIRPSGWKEAAGAHAKWLRSLQLTRASGWADHPAQGGFRMGSNDVPRPPHPGHVDLSMTRRVVEALMAAGMPASDPAVTEAVDFARRCRTPLGGFEYTATDSALNKGPTVGDPGYGSATADGVLLLYAAGRRYELERSVLRLRQQHRRDLNPGVEAGKVPVFATAMRGYYRASAARVFALRDGPVGWQRALAASIVAEQFPDGSWKNQDGAQKEDEPIIATGFALVALAAALASD
jgi:hypothetical protein